MIIASAQTIPQNDDINRNLHDHYRLIKLAADNGVKLIVFPEMSITGYVRESAKKLSFKENDSQLDKLRELAVDNDMIIIAGAPIKMDSGLHIGSFVISPDNSISIYTKQFLHAGEEEFYAPNFYYNPIIKLGKETISLAICADIDNPLHAMNANKANCTIYIASIFFTPNGMIEAYNLLSDYAKRYSMNVLMSNFCGESWSLKAGGKSAFWSKNGDLITGLDDKSTGLLIGQKNNDIWRGMIVKDN